jgi:putrescine transport system substrate-binding protein
VRAVDSARLIGELASGGLCLALGWSGDVMLARYRALQSPNGVKIRYFVPREGGLVGSDMMSIPADAPHPLNAQIWINYIMRPEVMADITNSVKYPNGNRASLRFVHDAIKNDPAIYPDADTRAKLHVELATPPELVPLVTRLWTRFRAGE